jgi:hypothetical protein
MKRDDNVLLAAVIAESHRVPSLTGNRRKLKFWGWIACF